MFIKVLKSKIQYLKVTEKNLRYSGSIKLDEDIIKEANLFPNEMVLVVNINNGARFETYVIPAKKGSRTVGLQGGAARLGEIGDELIVMSYCFVDEKELKNHIPKILTVDSKNRIKR